MQRLQCALLSDKTTIVVQYSSQAKSTVTEFRQRAAARTPNGDKSGRGPQGGVALLEVLVLSVTVSAIPSAAKRVA